MDHWLLVITRSLFPFKLYIFHSMKHDIRDFLFIYSFPLTHFRNLSLDSNTVHGRGSETSPTSFSGRSSQDSVSTLLSLLLPKITGPSSTSHSMWCRMSPQSRYGGPDKWTRFYSLLVAFISSTTIDCPFVIYHCHWLPPQFGHYWVVISRFSI